MTLHTNAHNAPLLVKLACSSLQTSPCKGAYKLYPFHKTSCRPTTVNGKALRAHLLLQTFMLFDFLPVRATSPVTAASLLAGRKWPGVIRERQLKRIPKHRCKYIGESKMPRVILFGRAGLLHWSNDSLMVSFHLHRNRLQEYFVQLNMHIMLHLYHYVTWVICMDLDCAGS